MSYAVLMGSDSCELDDLFLDYGTEAERSRLGRGAGWPRRWTGTWRTSGGEVACAVRDLGEASVAGCVPVRRPAGSTLGAAPIYVSRYPRRPRKPRPLMVIVG